MNENEQRWAEAFYVLQEHGSDAMLHAKSQIDILMNAGDDAGMLQWFEILQRLEELAVDQNQTH